jgi:hypothetical protein
VAALPPDSLPKFPELGVWRRPGEEELRLRMEIYFMTVVTDPGMKDTLLVRNFIAKGKQKHDNSEVPW